MRTHCSLRVSQELSKCDDQQRDWVGPSHQTHPCPQHHHVSTLDTLGLRDSFPSPPPHPTSSLWCLQLYPCPHPVPALSIHARYPLSSRSICCWRRSFMKARRFSTRSRSLANSLGREGHEAGLRAGLRAGSRMPRGLGNHGTESRDRGDCWGRARPSPAKAWPEDGGMVREEKSRD